MTMLSQYLAIEVADHSEPVSFYAPGADAWYDHMLGIYRARATHILIDDGDVFIADIEDELNL